MKAKPAIKKTQGTFAVPRYFIPEGSPAYAEAQKLFGQIKWRKQPKRPPLSGMLSAALFISNFQVGGIGR